MSKIPVSRRIVLLSLTAIAAADLTGLAQGKPGGEPEATAAQKSASQLHSDDRGVKQEQWGWRPFDQSTAQFNPPSFVWPHEDRATKTPCYTLQWAANKDFRDAVTIDKLPLNAYTHHAPLKPGTYYWRYRYTRGSEPSEWSYVRTFTLPADAIVFPMPSPEQREQRIPQGHPRLFLRPEDLPRLRKLAAGEGAAAGAFAVVRQRADAALAAPLPEEPLGLKKDWPRRVAALKALVDGEAMAFTYLITQDRKYADAAEKWLLQLASWDPLHGATAFDKETGGDEASLPMLHRMARIYDWAYDGLSLQARAKVLGVLRVRAADEWKGFQFGSGPGLFNYPYSSHANRAWHKLAETAIATYRELPESEMYLNCALNKFFAAYPVWSDEDGGWHEGLRYWNDYMCKVVWWLQVAQSALQINGFQKPYFAHIGDYPMYLAPPGAANSGFGDMGYDPPRTEYGEYMNYYIREVARAVPGGGHSAYWRWWTEAWKMPPNLPDRDAPDGGILYFLYTANLGPLPAPKTPSDIPQSKVFRGVGVAALHKTLLDANDDVEILFKSSPFGRKSHGHEPQNDFMLNAYGESLLAGNSYRDSHHSKFHVLWVYKSQSHNTVGVNGEGQLSPPVRMRTDPPSLGKIIDFALQPCFDYVTGDATEAYGGRLTRAIRTIAFAKPDLVVVCDDLAAAEPSSYQFYLHGLSAFQVDATAQRLSLQQPKAGVEVQYLGPTSLDFTQTDGYTPKPNKIAILGECPNQWHVMASTPHKSPSLVMLTVVVPYKSGAKVHWSAERLESPTAVGVRVRRGDAVTLVAFKKAGIDSNASLDGLSFGQRTALRTQEKE